MQRRRRFKQSVPLKERLAAFADDARAQADRLRPGAERDELIKKIRSAETAAHIDELGNIPRDMRAK